MLVENELLRDKSAIQNYFTVVLYPKLSFQKISSGTNVLLIVFRIMLL